MSYLDAPRLHFVGKYFANPSTINNQLNNSDLKPPLKLSWNPDGSAFFHFLGGRVSSAVRGDGTVLSGGADDPITQATVTTPQSPPTKVAKIVDLDPDQQSITQLFGVVVTLIDNPTWVDVQPVLNQYAVLYPAMTRRIDLSNDEAVFSHSAEILDVISLPILDPAHMPVTRDLSASHRTLIQTWIKNGCPRGETHA